MILDSSGKLLLEKKLKKVLKMQEIILKKQKRFCKSLINGDWKKQQLEEQKEILKKVERRGLEDNEQQKKILEMQ